MRNGTPGDARYHLPGGVSTTARSCEHRPTSVLGRTFSVSSRLRQEISYVASTLRFHPAYARIDLTSPDDSGSGYSRRARSDLFPYCDFSCVVEPEWAHAANVKGIRSGDGNHGWSCSMSWSHVAKQRRPVRGTCELGFCIHSAALPWSIGQAFCGADSSANTGRDECLHGAIGQMIEPC